MKSRLFTLRTQEEIKALIKEHEKAPHLRQLQKELAQEITVRVHSQMEYDMALKASDILFGKATTQELEGIDEKTLLTVFEGVPQVEISHANFDSTADVTALLSEGSKGTVFQSKGEARRMIQGGGVSINKSKLTAPDQKVDFGLLQGKYLLIQKGKKNYYLLKVV